MPMVIAILTAVVYVPLAYYLVAMEGIGINGFGIATAVANAIRLVALIIYASKMKKLNDGIFCPTIDSFQGWYSFLSISFPSTIMICAEEYFFEIMVALAGIMGVMELNV